jgi:predicted DNA-binding protein (MmcQ/YjbR family)
MRIGKAEPFRTSGGKAAANHLEGVATNMDIEQVHAHCLSFPHVTEVMLWGNDLVFKIGGKMFAVIGLDPASDHCMSFKCTPEKFAELIERNGIVPAPYVARYHWVALERFNALSEKELKALLRTAYELVLAKLPKKARAELPGKGNSKKAIRTRR